MYYYDDNGVVFNVSDIGEEQLIDAYNRIFGKNAKSLDDIDDAMDLGDYCSPDNISEAEINGIELDTEEGLFVLREPYNSENEEQIAALLEYLGLDCDWDNAPSDSTVIGNFHVACYQ